jgi:hypothetical protein
MTEVVSRVTVSKRDDSSNPSRLASTLAAAKLKTNFDFDSISGCIARRNEEYILFRKCFDQNGGLLQQSLASQYGLA